MSGIGRSDGEPDVVEVPVVLMRGGTSKGVFVSADRVPPAGPARDRFLLALMGSPDPMQLNGLGGTHSSTSKVMIVSGSSEPDTDVDYLFAQVGIDRPVVDYKGNCGNLTAAVGAYAIDEGLATPTGPVCAVRMRNLNTGRRIVAHVPIVRGRCAIAGDAVDAGVPGSGAGIITEYLDPSGAVSGSMLPTGSVRDVLQPALGAAIEVSVVDVTSPVVILRARDLGIDPADLPNDLNSDRSLLARLESIRAAAAILLGLSPDEPSALSVSPAVPRVAVVSSPFPHRAADGAELAAADHDLAVRATSMQKIHHATPLTSAMCLAAATRIPGTIAAEQCRTPEDDRASTPVRIAHAKGISTFTVRLGAPVGQVPVAIASVSVVRTARRLLTGTALVVG